MHTSLFARALLLYHGRVASKGLRHPPSYMEVPTAYEYAASRWSVPIEEVRKWFRDEALPPPEILLVIMLRGGFQSAAMNSLASEDLRDRARDRLVEIIERLAEEVTPLADKILPNKTLDAYAWQPEWLKLYQDFVRGVPSRHRTTVIRSLSDAWL